MRESVKKLPVPAVDPSMFGTDTMAEAIPFMNWFVGFPSSDEHKDFNRALAEADKRLAKANDGQGRTLSHEDIEQYMAAYGRSGEWKKHLPDLDSGFFIWFQMELRREAQRCQVFAELFMQQIGI